MTYPILKSLRIIESSAFIAAPLAGLTLAQYGADVIRIDMIGGGIDYGRLPLMPSGRSLYWAGLNKGKRSIAIDIKSSQGRELAQALVEQSGTLLTNIGTPWLSHELLAQKRSDLISCTIEGNSDGSTAVDYTVNCATGYPAITGAGSAQQPVNHVLPAWDIACAYQAAFAIMAAVHQRHVTGQGAQLKLALSDVAFSALSHLGVLAEAQLLEQDRPSLGNHIYGAFGRDFATADKHRVMVAAISAGQWASLVKACDKAAEIKQIELQLGCDLGNEAHRYEAREHVVAVFESWFAARPLSEVTATLNAHRVCWGPYRTTRESLQNDDRLGLKNPLFEQITTEGIGTHISAGPAIRWAEYEKTQGKPAPVIGHHTDEVLAQVLGLSAAQIGKMHDQKIVA